ncbi:hypothetical protein, partial [Skermanella aerolata]|uniref:hypothetical protein n=1 Tax=Skermanella aerolata TaxID=393310 RepID=UPI0005CB1BBB
MPRTKRYQSSHGVIKDRAQLGKVEFASHGGVSQAADDQTLVVETTAGVGPLRLQSPCPLGFQTFQNSRMDFRHGSPRPHA